MKLVSKTGIALLLFGSLINAMQKMPILVGITALVKQSELARATVLARRWCGDRYIPLISEASVGHAFSRVCTIPCVAEHISARERVAHVRFYEILRANRLKFYGFMDGVPTSELYPTVLFEGDALPQLMAGWVLGKISVDDAAIRSKTYVNTLGCDASTKNFLYMLIDVTFSPEIMEDTCTIDSKTYGKMLALHEQGFPMYVIGHCDPISHAQLRHKVATAELLEKCTVKFSYQVAEIDSHTQFTDEWWLTQLGLKHAGFSSRYRYIDDGTQGKIPFHCVAGSSELQRLIDEVK